AIVGRDFFIDNRLTAVIGDRTAALEALDAGGAVILPVALSQRLGLDLGEHMTVPVDGTSSVDLEVVAIVERSMPGTSGESILVGWKDATESLGVLGADAFVARFVPGRELEAREG